MQIVALPPHVQPPQRKSGGGPRRTSAHMMPSRLGDPPDSPATLQPSAPTSPAVRSEIGKSQKSPGIVNVHFFHDGDAGEKFCTKQLMNESTLSGEAAEKLCTKQVTREPTPVPPGDASGRLTPKQPVTPVVSGRMVERPSLRQLLRGSTPVPSGEKPSARQPTREPTPIIPASEAMRPVDRSSERAAWDASAKAEAGALGSLGGEAPRPQSTMAEATGLAAGPLARSEGRRNSEPAAPRMSSPEPIKDEGGDGCRQQGFGYFASQLASAIDAGRRGSRPVAVQRGASHARACGTPTAVPSETSLTMRPESSLSNNSLLEMPDPVLAMRQQGLMPIAPNASDAQEPLQQEMAPRRPMGESAHERSVQSGELQSAVAAAKDKASQRGKLQSAQGGLPMFPSAARYGSASAAAAAAQAAIKGSRRPVSRAG